MPKTLTATDRKSLIRLASTMPVGSPERKAILAGLQGSSRVAGLKTAGEHPLGRMSIVYFDLIMEDYNIEEDAENGDEFAQSLMDGDGRGALKLESDAIKNLSRMFGKRISNEGHSNDGSLICNFAVNSWAEVNKALSVINRNHTGGDDNIDTGVRYFEARDFRLYPDGTNDVFYGEGNGAEDDWDEWLSDHK
jgi:hypothetical protein